MSPFKPSTSLGKSPPGRRLPQHAQRPSPFIVAFIILLGLVALMGTVGPAPVVSGFPLDLQVSSAIGVDSAAGALQTLARGPAADNTAPLTAIGVAALLVRLIPSGGIGARKTERNLGGLEGLRPTVGVTP